ncbi:hemerythrin domain-containing protein [Dactylosporangium sp. AC04546]|uniref:hemerythrin domain-containing protein n=1 Tax=Dactylosporangium sp. AC04546 TaxID=2862460 RepID=UPI001EDE7825|nr:hemerythrin domain-containing protein [Dactylosporangium sp. AC04546]WVK80378.1 hemerythrin domain-containing protein [Dactylosporangium sp. AC04546]
MLPPLPPVADELEFAGRSMLELLDEDHHLIGQLCTRLEADPASRDLEDVLVATVSRHISAEEQYLYPAVRQVLPDGAPIVTDEVAADEALLVALRRLHTTPAGDAAHEEALRTVTEQAREHARRTASVFPRLRSGCSGNDLVRLGNRVEIARSAAPTRPHPGTPATPPLNKIVDPAVAVVDKLRDALTGRTTWAEDLY